VRRQSCLTAIYERESPLEHVISTASYALDSFSNVYVRLEADALKLTTVRREDSDATEMHRQSSRDGDWSHVTIGAGGGAAHKGGAIGGRHQQTDVFRSALRTFVDQQNSLTCIRA